MQLFQSFVSVPAWLMSLKLFDAGTSTLHLQDLIWRGKVAKKKLRCLAFPQTFLFFAKVFLCRDDQIKLLKRDNDW